MIFGHDPKCLLEQRAGVVPRRTGMDNPDFYGGLVIEINRRAAEVLAFRSPNRPDLLLHRSQSAELARPADAEAATVRLREGAEVSNPRQFSGAQSVRAEACLRYSKRS